MAPPWELRRRGLKDSLRHDQRVKEAIRKNLRELIAEEAIITSDGQKRVRIPLRYLEQYRFKYGQPQEGVGQGPGKPGDLLGRQGGDGTGPGDGQAGDQPGELTYEVEVPLDELTRMMLEDLALPWLEEKPERQVTTITHRHTDIRRRGSLANLDKRRTLLANIKRNASRGVAEVGHLHDDDLRFKVWDEHEQKHANAAVYMLMDRSGSMTTSKKYVAKSFFFWRVRFLRLKYQHVETVSSPMTRRHRRCQSRIFSPSPTAVGRAARRPIKWPWSTSSSITQRAAGIFTSFTFLMAIISRTTTPSVKRWCRICWGSATWWGTVKSATKTMPAFTAGWARRPT
jgi:uncharacterized sporulation protein YeaH/YhbH (DUF444 family)